MARLILALCLLVAGCASQANRDALIAYQSECQTGNAEACWQANRQAEANHEEATTNAGNIALIAVLLPLAILVGALGGGSVVLDDVQDHAVDAVFVVSHDLPPYSNAPTLSSEPSGLNSM